MFLFRRLTDEIQEGARDQQVCGPVEAVGEGKRSSSDLSGEYFTQEKPGHCAETRQGVNEELTEMSKCFWTHETSTSPL